MENIVCMHACSVAQSCQTPCDPMNCRLPGFSVHGIFRGQEYGGGLPFPPPGDLPNPGIEPAHPAAPVLEGKFFTTEPHGKPGKILCSFRFFHTT